MYSKILVSRAAQSRITSGARGQRKEMRGHPSELWYKLASYGINNEHAFRSTSRRPYNPLRIRLHYYSETGTCTLTYAPRRLLTWSPPSSPSFYTGIAPHGCPLTRPLNTSAYLLTPSHREPPAKKIPPQTHFPSHLKVYSAAPTSHSPRL